MIGTGDLPLVIIQTPEVQRVQHAEQSHPEHQQAVLAESVLKEQRKSRNKIAKSEDTESKKGIDSDRDPEQQGAGRQNRRPKDEDEHAVDSQDDGLIQTHLVDIRV